MSKLGCQGNEVSGQGAARRRGRVIGWDCRPGEVWGRADGRGSADSCCPPGLLCSNLTFRSGPFFPLVSARMWRAPHLCPMPTLPSTSLLPSACLSPAYFQNVRQALGIRVQRSIENPPVQHSWIVVEELGNGHTDNQHSALSSARLPQSPPLACPCTFVDVFHRLISRLACGSAVVLGAGCATMRKISLWCSGPYDLMGENQPGNCHLEKHTLSHCDEYYGRNRQIVL